MKILITGSSGLVGSNVKNILIKEGHSILAPSSNELNLLNFKDTNDYLILHKPDFIIHAAGKVGGIQANILSPFEFYYNNLEMGKNIIIAARENQILNLINLASSCMYPSNHEGKLRESDLLSGPLETTNEGYALAKISVMKFCQYINMQNSAYNYKTIIPCNLYGEGDKFDPNLAHMIPSVIDKIHRAKINNEKYVEIWGDGKARREFMHVQDLAECINFAINSFKDLPEVMNVGLGFDFTIKEYYDVISNVIGYEGAFVYNMEKPVGMKRKLLSIERQLEFGWCAKIGLKEGISRTYEYYLKHYSL